ncbi:MAG: 16S rRNA (uracil(1498)-N(3))-methyltransferase [Ignavibacteriales bacterium]|nr:16S rRNA (uracil(1498)-N(3))-methyltransferase [Ignavibacteriales bacterium]
MILEFLSNIELFYAPRDYISRDTIILRDEELKHAVKVMRYKAHDKIFITNGEGNIYECSVLTINKDFLDARINNLISYQNKFQKVIFCLPKLKNPERIRFLIEKCVELGVTNFILFDADRSISKSNNIERWNKIALAAMKQSIRSFLPQISLAGNLDWVVNSESEKIIFEQSAKKALDSIELIKSNTYFIFGPEGGLSQRELNLFEQKGLFRLTKNRLRSETAAIFTAGFLNSILER